MKGAFSMPEDTEEVSESIRNAVYFMISLLLLKLFFTEFQLLILIVNMSPRSSYFDIFWYTIYVFACFCAHDDMRYLLSVINNEHLSDTLDIFSSQILNKKERNNLLFTHALRINGIAAPV